MSPERIDELIALAALGELTPSEEHELDAATRRDPALAAEVDDALATAAGLQRGAAEAPPAELRANVMAAIAATPQDHANEDSGPSFDVPHDELAPVASMHAERTRRRRLFPILLGAAAALVFVIGAFIVSNEAAAPDEYAAVLDASDAVTHEIEGDLGTLTVTFSESHNAMVVAGEGITPLTADETYQLWVDIDGHMTPAGLFRPDDAGRVEQRIDDVDTTGASINVTEEPAGGSDEPTLPVLATSV